MPVLYRGSAMPKGKSLSPWKSCVTYSDCVSVALVIQHAKGTAGRWASRHDEANSCYWQFVNAPKNVASYNWF